MAISTSQFEKKYIETQALEMKAKRILEIGCFKGETTAILSSVAQQTGGKVVALDPMIWKSEPSHFWEWVDGLLHPFSYEKHFWKNVRATGHDNVRLIRGLSTDAHILESEDPDLQEFDFAFIDGEHTFRGVMSDIGNWGWRVRKGGLILLHDVVRRFDGVVQAMKLLEKDPHLEVTWPTRGTVGRVLVKERLDGSHYLRAIGILAPPARASQVLVPELV